MKEKILTALKAKFQGGNADILDRIATMLAKTITSDEQVTTAVEGVTKDYIDVIEAYGDSRATNTQKTAILNYERKHGLKDGQKVEKMEVKTDTAPTTAEDTTPAWAKALIESNKQLTERLNKMEGEKTTATRKAVLEGIVSKLPPTLRKAYSRISVDTMTDEQFTALQADVTAEVEEISKENKARGAVFGRPTAGGDGTGGNVNEASEAELNAVMEKLNL